MTGALVGSRISVKAFLFMEGPMSVAVVIVHGLEHGAQQNLPNREVLHALTVEHQEEARRFRLGPKRGP